MMFNPNGSGSEGDGLEELGGPSTSDMADPAGDSALNKPRFVLTELKAEDPVLDGDDDDDADDDDDDDGGGGGGGGDDDDSGDDDDDDDDDCED